MTFQPNALLLLPQPRFAVPRYFHRGKVYDKTDIGRPWSNRCAEPEGFEER